MKSVSYLLGIKKVIKKMCENVSEHNKRVYRATIGYEKRLGKSDGDIHREFGLIFSKEEIDNLIKNAWKKEME